MKKLCALLVTAMLLFSVSVPVFADDVISPSGKPTQEDATDDSPKTGDVNLFYAGLAGTACAALAVGATVKAKKEA